MSMMSTDNLDHMFSDDPYIGRNYSRNYGRNSSSNYSGIPKAKPKANSQSLPWFIGDNIFYSISYAEIDTVANRDYTVIQLDYFPHSPKASLTRSDLYKAARKL